MPMLSIPFRRSRVYIQSSVYKENLEQMPRTFKTEVETMIDNLLKNNGFWEVTDETLDQISEEISQAFDFTVNQAKAI